MRNASPDGRGTARHGRHRGRALIGIILVAAIGVLGLAGCGRITGTGDATGADATSALSPEGQALQAIGFDSNDILAADTMAMDNPSPQPSAQSGQANRAGKHPLRKWRRLRLAFNKRMLHAQAVVQTANGTRTIVVQRGTVTAIDATSVTVKSADGYTLTWTFGNPIHVVEHRTQVQPSAIKPGTMVGVAGTTDGSTDTAKLIVVPNAG